jgi:hypothetical protein
VQCVEVEVAVVPTPRVIILAYGEAERLGHVEVEDVEAIGAAPDFDEKPAALIPDLQNALVDFHLRAAPSNCPRLMMELRSAGMK